MDQTSFFTKIRSIRKFALPQSVSSSSFVELIRLLKIRSEMVFQTIKRLSSSSTMPSDFNKLASKCSIEVMIGRRVYYVQLGRYVESFWCLQPA